MKTPSCPPRRIPIIVVMAIYLALVLPSPVFAAPAVALKATPKPQRHCDSVQGLCLVNPDNPGKPCTKDDECRHKECAPAVGKCMGGYAGDGPDLCSIDSECEARSCDQNGRCVLGSGETECHSDQDCVKHCVDNTCTISDEGLEGSPVCTEDSECDEEKRCTENGTCSTDGTGSPCTNSNPCIKRCDGDTCSFLGSGAPCSQPNDCKVSRCSENGGCSTAGTGALCSSPSDCSSTRCDLRGRCQPSGVRGACSSQNDCVGAFKVCHSGSCIVANESNPVGKACIEDKDCEGNSRTVCDPKGKCVLTAGTGPSECTLDSSAVTGGEPANECLTKTCDANDGCARGIHGGKVCNDDSECGSGIGDSDLVCDTSLSICKEIDAVLDVNRGAPCTTLGERCAAKGTPTAETTSPADPNYRYRLNVQKLFNEQKASSPNTLARLDNLTPTAVRGPADAAAVVDIFQDLTCSMCRKAYRTWTKGALNKDNNVRFRIHDLPLVADQSTLQAMKYARCAAQEGKYFEFLDQYFAGENLGGNAAHTAATKVVDSPTELARCVASTSTEKYLKTARDDAISFNIDGTPTFYVNGVRREGTRNMEELDELVNTFLSASPSK